MEAVDKVDSGHLTIDEIQNPKGWILIGFLMDREPAWDAGGTLRSPTTSNGASDRRLPHHEHRGILNLPDVQERIEVYFEQTEKFMP